MSRRLENKVALVTGAASGLGQEVAHLMAKEGAAVVVFDRDADGAERVAKAVTEAGGRALAHPGDVTSAADFDAAIAAAQSTFGGFHIIHNNAGVQLEKRLHETSEEDFDWIAEINLKGVFLGCRAAVRAFLDAGNGGTIVNTASILAHVGDPYLPAYTATKSGVLGLTRSIAVDYAADKIRANCVSPGDMETPMVQKYFDSTPDPAATRATMEAAYPGKRFGHPREVAQAVLFLASDESSFISGEFIIVDGGLLAKTY
jgi:NAD(P)-dependent dehydrogenase (short-subunit alcohol dehydrogenase family)